MMRREDLSIPMQQAASRSLMVVLPILFLQISLFMVVHSAPMLPQNGNIFMFAFLLLAGLLVHEWIHVMVWAWFAKKHLDVFIVGFQWKTLTPYAHCREPLDIQAYRIGTVAPGLLLGIFPWLVSLITGDMLLIMFGLMFTAAAGGDFLVLWILRTVEAGSRVEDHPTNAGCYVLKDQG